MNHRDRIKVGTEVAVDFKRSKRRGAVTRRVRKRDPHGHGTQWWILLHGSEHLHIRRAEKEITAV